MKTYPLIIALVCLFLLGIVAGWEIKPDTKCKPKVQVVYTSIGWPADDDSSAFVHPRHFPNIQQALKFYDSDDIEFINIVHPEKTKALQDAKNEIGTPTFFDQTDSTNIWYRYDFSGRIIDTLVVRRQ